MWYRGSLHQIISLKLIHYNIASLNFMGGIVTTIFLDRDGVINENRPDYVKSWGEFCFLPGSREAIAKLPRQAIASLFVPTRQA